jgi:hypothetical protein
VGRVEVAGKALVEDRTRFACLGGVFQDFAVI